MLVIGLTGTIGSGKSTVAQFFSDLNVPCIDSDQIAREMVVPGTSAFLAIVERFGPAILNTNGTLNRSFLRTKIFHTEADRIWLENLLHPLIRAAMQQQLATLQAPYVLLVIPLLVGRPPNPLIQRILVVTGDIDLQKKRVLARDHLDTQTIEAILATQASQEALLEAADDVLINNGSLEELKKEVLKLHHQYLNLAS